MNKLKSFAKTIAFPLFLALVPSCAYSMVEIRAQLLEQLGAEHAGPQEDGSVVYCMGNRRRSSTALLRSKVNTNFQHLHEGKIPHIEILEEGGVACAKASAQSGETE